MQFERVVFGLPRHAAASVRRLGLDARVAHGGPASGAVAQARALERLEERAKRAMNLALTSSTRRQGGNTVPDSVSGIDGSSSVAGGGAGRQASDVFSHPARRQLEEVHALWTAYQQEGHPVSPTMYSIAIQLHAETKNWGLGLRLFKMHADIDWRVSGLKAAMWCAAQCGDVNALLTILRKIEERRATVNRRMLELLFTTCVKAGEPARAYAVLQQLLARGGGLSASAYSAIMANALEMNEADRGVAALRDQIRHLHSSHPSVKGALAAWHSGAEAAVRAALLQGLATGAEPPSLADCAAGARVPSVSSGDPFTEHSRSHAPNAAPSHGWSSACVDPVLEAHLHAAMPLIQRCWSSHDVESLVTGLRTLQAAGRRLPRGTVDMLLAEAVRTSHPYLAEFCVAELVLAGQPLTPRHANALAKTYADADDLEGAFRTIQLMTDYGQRANAYAAGSSGEEASVGSVGGASAGAQTWAGEWLVTNDTLLSVQNAISRLFTLVETYRKEAFNGLDAFGAEAAMTAANAAAAETAASAAAAAAQEEAAAAGGGGAVGIEAFTTALPPPPSSDPADDAALYGLDGASAPSPQGSADLWSLIMGGDATAAAAAGTAPQPTPAAFAASGTDSEAEESGQWGGQGMGTEAAAAKAAQVAAAAGVTINQQVASGAAGSGGGSSLAPAASLHWRAGLLLGLDYDGSSSSLSDGEGAPLPSASPAGGSGAGGASDGGRDRGAGARTSASAALKEMFTGQGSASKAWSVQPLAGAAAGLDSPAILLSLALHGSASALALGPSWPLAYAHYFLSQGRLWLAEGGGGTATTGPLPLEDSTMTLSRTLCGLREGRHFFSVRLKDFFGLSSSGAPLAPAPAPTAAPLSQIDRFMLQSLVPPEVAAHYTGLYAFTSPAGIVPGGRPLTRGPLVSIQVFNAVLAGLAAGRGGSLVTLAVRIAAAEAYYSAPAPDAGSEEVAVHALLAADAAGSATAAAASVESSASTGFGYDRDALPSFSPDFIGESHFGGDAIPLGTRRAGLPPGGGGWLAAAAAAAARSSAEAPRVGRGRGDPDLESAPPVGSGSYYFGDNDSSSSSGSGGSTAASATRGSAGEAWTSGSGCDQEVGDDEEHGGAHTTVFSLVPASTRRFTQDTYVAQLAACATAAQDCMPATHALLQDLLKRGLVPTSRVYAAVAHNMVRCQRSSAAVDVLFHAARAGRPPAATVFESVARGLVADVWTRVVTARPHRRYTAGSSEHSHGWGSPWQRLVDDVSRTVKRVLRAPDTAMFGGKPPAAGGASASPAPASALLLGAGAPPEVWDNLAAVLGKCVGGSRDPAVDAELQAAGRELAVLLELAHRVGYHFTLPLTVSLAASLACVDANELPPHLRPAAALQAGMTAGDTGPAYRSRGAWRGHNEGREGAHHRHHNSREGYHSRDSQSTGGGYSSRAKAVDLE